MHKIPCNLKTNDQDTTVTRKNNHWQVTKNSIGILRASQFSELILLMSTYTLASVSTTRVVKRSLLSSNEQASCVLVLAVPVSPYSMYLWLRTFWTGFIRSLGLIIMTTIMILILLPMSMGFITIIHKHTNVNDQVINKHPMLSKYN